jgi:hypothetical protein
MNEPLKTILLLALPASGKSEVRRYLKNLSQEECRRDFHMGPTVQLDDFPYVHMMRRVDDELAAAGKKRLFFHSPARPFLDTRDWGTLIQLVNEDHEDLVSRKAQKIRSAANWLLDRMDAAAALVGIPRRLSSIQSSVRKSIENKLEEEARKMLSEKQESQPDTLSGRTLIIEFARGGPQGATMPLPDPLGYQYSLGQLSSSILETATILYVWVTPEESRRKNQERADPKDPGSILHHGVPIEVMMNDYGCDDMDWLERNSKVEGTITVSSRNRTFCLPIARFDNRVDKTSFIRNDPAAWKPDQIRSVHEELKNALEKLANARPRV